MLYRGVSVKRGYTVDIALLSPPFGPQRRDGIINTVGKYAAELERRGHNVVMVQHRGDGYDTRDTVHGVLVYRPYEFLAFESVPFDIGSQGRDPLVTYALAVWKAQQEFGVTFDVIHSFGAAPLAALRNVFCRVFSDATSIYTMKSMPADSDGYGPRSLRYSNVLNAVDGVGAATPSLKRELVDSGCKTPIEVIPPNIDLDSFRPVDVSTLEAELGYESNTVVLYYGHFREIKGVHVLLRSIAQVVDEYPSVRCILAWSRGGDLPHDSDGGRRDRYDDLIDELQIDEYVDIYPWEPGFPINEYVNLADMVVLPYTKLVEMEAVPLCVVESMAAKKPVVSTRHSHLTDFFSHGDDIYLVDPDDATALAEGIRTLIDSPTLRAEVAESGHNRTADFSLETVTDDYLRLYDR